MKDTTNRSPEFREFLAERLVRKGFPTAPVDKYIVDGISSTLAELHKHSRKDAQYGARQVIIAAPASGFATPTALVERLGITKTARRVAVKQRLAAGSGWAVYTHARRRNGGVRKKTPEPHRFAAWEFWKKECRASPTRSDSRHVAKALDFDGTVVRPSKCLQAVSNREMYVQFCAEHGKLVSFTVFCKVNVCKPAWVRKLSCRFVCLSTRDENAKKIVGSVFKLAPSWLAAASRAATAASVTAASAAAAAAAAAYSPSGTSPLPPAPSSASLPPSGASPAPLAPSPLARRPSPLRRSPLRPSPLRRPPLRPSPRRPSPLRRPPRHSMLLRLSPLRRPLLSLPSHHFLLSLLTPLRLSLLRSLLLMPTLTGVLPPQPRHQPLRLLFRRARVQTTHRSAKKIFEPHASTSTACTNGASVRLHGVVICTTWRALRARASSAPAPRPAPSFKPRIRLSNKSTCATRHRVVLQPRP